MTPAVSNNPVDQRFLWALLAALALHALLIFGLGPPGTQIKPLIPTQILDVILVTSPSEVEPEEAQAIAEQAQIAQPLPVPEDASPVSEPDRAESAPSKPSLDELLSSSLDLARGVQADGSAQTGTQPRIHYLDALSAKSAIEAAYIEAWVRKVEQVGNSNYPGAARREGLSGQLLLSVLLDQNGRVISIQLGQSSGHAILDEAARHIVALASPFAPFPPEMRRQYDQLMITRTWAFRGERLTPGR